MSNIRSHLSLLYKKDWKRKIYFSKSGIQTARYPITTDTINPIGTSIRGSHLLKRKMFMLPSVPYHPSTGSYDDRSYDYSSCHLLKLLNITRLNQNSVTPNKAKSEPSIGVLTAAAMIPPAAKATPIFLNPSAINFASSLFMQNYTTYQGYSWQNSYVGSWKGNVLWKPSYLQMAKIGLHGPIHPISSFMPIEETGTVEDYFYKHGEYFYGDDCPPWDTKKNFNAYLKRLTNFLEYQLSK